MRLSVSNLAWGSEPVQNVVPALAALGINGIEIAPTALWPTSPNVSSAETDALRSLLDEYGMRVSGLQSLLYGHPEFQLLDRATWPQMQEHVRRVIHLGGQLGAQVAVFGSPKNRLRGDLPVGQADDVAAQFFTALEEDLVDADMVLTLEPNAPGYGADYLTTYPDVVRLADKVGSQQVAPQIDTGCLTMVDEDPAEAAEVRMPGHVHISSPQLAPLPGDIDHSRLASLLRERGYEGWVVLEMLPAGPDPLRSGLECAEWLVRVYGD